MRPRIKPRINPKPKITNNRMSILFNFELRIINYELFYSFSKVLTLV